MIAASVSAVPARPTKMQVKQPDGTTITIMVRGDENFHFICTEDGKPLVKTEGGAYCYASLDADGRIVATQQMAHDIKQRGSQELTFLKTYDKEASAVRSLGKQRSAERNAARISRLKNRGAMKAQGSTLQKGMAGPWGGEGIGVTGKRKGLVILVNFKDKAMQAAHTQEEWNNYFNQEGYSGNGNSGSVHDYFKAQSYGQFDLEFDVVGPVTVSKNMRDYGGNDAYGNDKDPGGMVYEACKLVDSKVNFADYDWDGDGEVDQVYLIYAGYGEASASNIYPETIWQHEWELTAAGYNLSLDGVKINTYGCSSELTGYKGTTMDGIGTACHEFSHCLGLPDLYDTDYSGGFGMGEWDLMDAGSYAGDGYRPVGYNSYEKWVSGWLQPTELKSPTMVTDMKALSESPEAYVVYNEKTPTEYYLFENRQTTGTDTEIPAHGMLVLHVDYDKDVWENNAVNDNPRYQHLTIVPADNSLTDRTTDGDTYPGKKNNTELTDTSTPAAALFNINSDGRKYLGKPVTGIAEAGGLISFAFMGGINLDAPQELQTKEVTGNSFTAGWAAVEGAESYTLELRQKTDSPTVEEAEKITEDLSGWGEGVQGDSNTDISDELDYMMKHTGWTGQKVFECQGKAKLGSSKVVGYLISPAVADVSTSSVTVRVKSTTYSADPATMNVALLDAGGEVINTTQFAMNGSMATAVLDNPTGGDYKVKIYPKKRAYVEAIGIYDGAFTEDDFMSVVSAPKPVLAMGIKGKQTITGVTETTYRFENLEPSLVYQWRVKTVANNVVSSWTAWQDVELQTTPSCINGLTVTDGTQVEVFTVSGSPVGKMTYGRFLQSPLAAGIYLLKNGDSVVRVVK